VHKDAYRDDADTEIQRYRKPRYRDTEIQRYREIDRETEMSRQR
jgi:hypothetical protein